MECALVNSQIREVFHKWDCSLIESDELFAKLKLLGLCVCESFAVLIENHKRIRNIPFSVFLKALKLGQAPKSHNANPDCSPVVTSSRLMNALIFRDIPVSSSAKAPFGTDNNMFLRPPRSSDPLTAELISNVLPTERKRMGPVPGASNVFKETLVSEDLESVLSDMNSSVPRHLKSTLNPITGERFTWEAGDGVDESDTHSMSSIKRRAQDDHGDILSWCPEDALPPLCSRRHYPAGAVQEEPPMEQPPLEAFTYARNFTRDSPICHIEPTVNHHRRLMKSVQSKPLSFCPFATDTDDLETMRRMIRQKPLGSVFAPSPTTAR